MAAQGTPPAIVQIGNEINSGILFPDGSDWNPPNWNNLAGFLAAGASAVKACAPPAKVILPPANRGDKGAFPLRVHPLPAPRVPFDIIRTSYFRYLHRSPRH